jgi:hypothetical protein
VPGQLAPSLGGWVGQKFGELLCVGCHTRRECRVVAGLGYTDKKEKKIFLIYKEIQSGAVAKAYMTNGLLIYGEIFAHFLI